MRAFVAALVLSCSMPALAQPDPEALISEGVALRERGEDAAALARFEEAHRLSPSPRALAQIALAEQALGRFVAAEAHLAEALSAIGDRFVARNRAHLEQALAEVRAQIGELSIRGRPDGARITIGGVVRGTLPLLAPIRLDHGTAQIEITAEGHEPFAAEVQIAGGSRVDLAADLRALPVVRHATPEAELPPPSAPAEWMLPTAIAAGAAGAIGIALGTGFAIAREDHAQARQTCSDIEPACRERYQAALDAEAGAIASFAIGGALIAGGATLLTLWLLESDSRPASGALRCGPGALTIACEARF